MWKQRQNRSFFSRGGQCRKPRTGKIEAELKRLQDEGTIEPVHALLGMGSSHCTYPETRRLHSHLWRLLKNCQSSVLAGHDPIPKVEDLVKNSLNWTCVRPISCYFWIKNLNCALPPTRTKDFSSTTVRMRYGISSAPETFQRNIMMENLLQNILFPM